MEIQDACQFKRVVAGVGDDKLIAVNFYASWCNPIKIPADELNVDMYYINSDKMYTFCLDTGITKLPVSLFYQNGQLLGKLSGYCDLDIVKMKFKK